MILTKTNQKSALAAKEAAQWIAFAPVVFQAARVLRNSGILLELEIAGKDGLTIEEIAEKLNLSIYGVRVLLESGLGIGLVELEQDRFVITKIGYFIIHDELTNIHMNFVNDVCYQGLFFLDKSIENGKPEGLKVFGEWPTIYEGLSKLPKNIQKSWFGFDHYHSDHAFPDALPQVFKYDPRKILDIGGNTGKWAIACTKYNPEVHAIRCWRTSDSFSVSSRLIFPLVVEITKTVSLLPGSTAVFLRASCIDRIRSFSNFVYLSSDATSRCSSCDECNNEA